MSERGLQVSPLASRAQDSTVETHTWAVVLAGGKGTRLSRLTRHVYGEDRPKQYAALTGGKSLLRQPTPFLDRGRPLGSCTVYSESDMKAWSW